MESGDVEMEKYSITVRCLLCVFEKEIFEVFLGGWDNLLSALAFFIVMEYLTHLMVTILNKKLSNGLGLSEIEKRVSIFLLVAMGNVIDTLIIKNGNIVRTSIIFFYLWYEGITILKNIAALGLPIPQTLKKIMEQIKDGRISK